MTVRQPPAPDARAAVLRFVLPGLLIVLVAAGLLGSVRTPGWTGPYHSDGIVIGVALEVVLAALLGVLLTRDRRAPAPADSVVVRLRRALRFVIIAGLIAIPITLLLNANLHVKAKRRPLKLPQPKPGRTPSRKPIPPRGVDLHLGWLPYALLAVVVLAAVVVCVVLAMRHKPRRGQAAFEDFVDEPEEELRAAVESGRTALLSLDGARAAIIACYLAMEQSLAQAGTARTMAETPDELLARAVRAGLARSAAAGTLTTLFYEARFSTHPMGQDQKDVAERALAEIAANLERPEPAEPTEPVGDHA
ncbi:MAG TPA: DUF4129 domain-containing protein [Streptosporangiaceae bacterium]|jgi:hypothetical protein